MRLGANQDILASNAPVEIHFVECAHFTKGISSVISHIF